jgi:hypothetical protein
VENRTRVFCPALSFSQLTPTLILSWGSGILGEELVSEAFLSRLITGWWVLKVPESPLRGSWSEKGERPKLDAQAD